MPKATSDDDGPGAPISVREQWQREFGVRLRELRGKRSQMDVALASRYHPTYISDIEQGRRNVSLSTIRQLAHALGVSPREFFD